MRPNPYSMYNSKRERAKALIWHYFHVLADRAGVENHLDHDTDSKIGDIVDCIIEAAAEDHRVNAHPEGSPL